MEYVVIFACVCKYSCKQCYIVLTTWFYNIIFKIKHKLYTASGSALPHPPPPGPKEKIWVLAWDKSPRYPSVRREFHSTSVCKENSSLVLYTSRTILYINDVTDSLTVATMLHLLQSTAPKWHVRDCGKCPRILKHQAAKMNSKDTYKPKSLFLPRNASWL
jgi:hypothetical protein